VNLNSESAGERPMRDIVTGEFFKSARRPARVGSRTKIVEACGDYVLILAPNGGCLAETFQRGEAEKAEQKAERYLKYLLERTMY